ncbi:LysR family transcriptional regulator [Pseudomonas sp. GD03860]|uniref:LysR family transcriptional regulator n=1 Tax=Pseudomonas TaxID=286 RepID=UPI002363DA6F|nr:MULTISPECIES: LysR family transcriptional regulator [Pseudomonas]MDD2057852.1 LysR family transcriptional regulator [Pseudomonas putida]MDH0640512.1 LysR family transcriptional regulator [Pseudomonas sp. GD03860]
MNKLELLRTFVRVSELSSFTLAGESLGLPRSTVSEQIRALETLLGTRLLNRTTRRVQATQDGLHLYERSKDLLSRMDEIEGLFHSDEAALSGRLRVDLPTLMARRIVLPNLPEFMARHPGVELELSCTDRQVDLVREGFDCVLRIGTLTDLDLVARPLGSLAQINCASPGYVQRHGTPTCLADLHRHQLIHYVRNLGSRSAGFEYLQAGTLQVQPMAGAITVNSAEAYESACLAGLGLIQAPAAGLQGYLERGELVALLADFVAPPLPVSLLYARQQHVPHRLRAFMEWLVALLEPRLDPAADGS